MRHPFWYRVLIAVWGLWFTTALSEPAGAHTCPMHGAHAGHAAQMGSAAHAAHGGHHAPDKPSSKACTCLGQCCSTPPVAIPAVPTEAVVARIVDVDVAVYGDRSAPVARRAYALPFANGPPNTLAL